MAETTARITEADIGIGIEAVADLGIEGRIHIEGMNSGGMVVVMDDSMMGDWAVTGD